MKNYGFVKGMAVRLFAVTLVLCEAISASSACRAPHYRVVRTRRLDAFGIFIDISIRLEDVAPGGLICLAGAVRERYPSQNITASIFSSREAAKGFVPGSIDVSPGHVAYQSSLHAFYSYNRERHEEYVMILPNGVTGDADPGIATRIDLPAPGTPVCRLAIHDRCLLEFQHIYPLRFEGKTEVSGRVTVAGKIGRKGAMSDLAVVDAEANPPERRSALAAWAKRNLSTWRFERGTHKDGVRIAYYFEGADPLVPYEYGVLFRLPNEVRILTGRTN